MLLFLLLLGVVLDAEASKECFNDLKKFQCSCIDQKGYTPFWTDHNKKINGNWTASISVIDSKCSEDDALDFIKHVNNTSSKVPGPGPGIDENVIQNMISKGYSKHGESLYKLHHNMTYWDHARRICIGEGSHLAIPNSDEEVLFLKTFLTEDIEEQIFVGMHDIFNEGEHVTVFGEPASIAYENFEKTVHLSNTNKPGLAGEDCLTVYKQLNLNDVTCGHTYHFLCELELRGYPPQREIDYNNGPYPGVESFMGLPKGTVKRTVPSMGYEYYPGIGFYRFHATPQNWDTARLVCEMEGGHLAIINSIFEHKILRKYFTTLLPKEIDDVDRVHIGFHDLLKEGQHVTLFNQTLEEAGFSEWFADNQPDNEKNNKMSSGQHCGVLHRDGGLDDFSCDAFLAYLCEQELYE